MDFLSKYYDFETPDEVRQSRGSTRRRRMRRTDVPFSKREPNLIEVGKNYLGRAVPKSSKTNCPAQRLKETLCRTELLSHIILTRSQCLTAAAEGAKLSTIYIQKHTPYMGLGPGLGPPAAPLLPPILCRRGPWVRAQVHVRCWLLFVYMYQQFSHFSRFVQNSAEHNLDGAFC